MVCSGLMKVTVPGTEKYSGLASGDGRSSLGFWMPCSVARLVPPPLPLFGGRPHLVSTSLRSRDCTSLTFHDTRYKVSCKARGFLCAHCRLLT